jgi:hypothetical protein
VMGGSGWGAGFGQPVSSASTAVPIVTSMIKRSMGIFLC